MPQKRISRLIGIFLVEVLILANLPSLLLAAATGGVEGVLTINSVPASDAVVYLRDISGVSESPPPMNLTIDQKDKAFSPDWSMVTVGSTIRFENHDEEIHNVRSVSTGNRFDLGAHLPETVKTVVLKKPGPVMLRCRIHDWMQAFIYVSPTTYYSETGPDGRFRLTNIPNGSYRIEAWHPRLTREEIESGGASVRVVSGMALANLDMRASAPVGADLTEVAVESWGKILDQIGSGLDQAKRLWKDGKSSSAMRRVLTTHSQFFGESGLSKAITQHIGESRTEEHDRRFNDLVKWVQREKTGAESEMRLKKDIERLVELLRKDVERLPGSL